MAQDEFGNYVVDIFPSTFTPGTSTGGVLHGDGPPSSGLGRDGQVYVNDLNGNLYSKTGGIWTLLATGFSGLAQVIVGPDNDPNGGSVLPDDPSKPALYYQDSSGDPALQFWRWSVADQVWKDIATT